MSLSGRLALLSILFIMLAEVIVLMPTLAYYRLNRLQARIDDAALVSTALLSTPTRSADPEQAELLLERSDVLNLALIYEDRRERLLIPTQSIQITKTLDLTQLSFFEKLLNAGSCFNTNEDDILRLVGTPTDPGPGIDITIHEKPLCDQVVSFGWNLLIISLLISFIAGGILYFAVQGFLVKPILSLTQAVTSFRGREEDQHQLIEPSSNIDEIREAEASLRDMQTRILNAFKQRGQLAILGESVAKIQHDLRNMLSTAQLIADNLEDSADPMVQKNTPRLMRALNRAITLSSQTLEFGRVGERKAQIKPTNLSPICKEIIAEEKSLARGQKIAWQIDLPKALNALVDEDFFRRVFTNIARNARQILAENGGGTVSISASAQGDTISLAIGDDGPGMSQAAREHLFQPFKGSTRKGGTGLGLALANELCQSMGGEIELVKSDHDGTMFKIFLPENPGISLAKPAASG